MKRIIIILIVPLFFPLPAQAQWKLKETTATRTEQPVLIDGLLDEAYWDKAPSQGDFIQIQPDRGAPGTFRTEFKVLYDEKFVYFGILCFDPDPEKIAARLTRRDSNLKADDSVYIMTDTLHDRRSCYYFCTNLLGTQWDGRITEHGRVSDDTWDGIWKCAAQRTDHGWSAEFAIDLSGIKYKPGINQTWGLNVGRGIPRNLEYVFWSGPLESAFHVSQYGVLNGLDLEKAEKKAQIIPHLITKLEEKKRTEFHAGLDARYAFSQLVSGNLTLNPDFATVEADQEQINLTRFEVNLPEKRHFFQEGSEVYRQRIRLFYSRRISDIYGGLKVYGKSGGFEFSGMSAQTKPDDELGMDSANFTVFRLKKDVMTSSTIGFLAANKLINGKNYGSAGMDAALYFTNNFRVTSQLALSYGDHDKGNVALFVRPSYDTPTFHIHIRYTHLGENFADNANHVGYFRDDNRHELDSALEKTIFLRDSVLERIQYGSNYNIYWGVDRILRSWKVDQELSFDLKNKLTLGLEHTQEYKLYEKDFRNNQTEILFGYNMREWQSAHAAYGFGRNFDSDFQLVKAGVNYKVTESLALSYSLVRLILEPDPEEETTWIHVIRATNYFTNDLFLKLFYQANTSIGKQNIQVVFVYRFQPPFGSVQLAYQKGTGRFGEKGTQGNTLFVKFAYIF